MRESSEELRELERKLKLAYGLKELKAQIAQREADKLAEKVVNVLYLGYVADVLLLCIIAERAESLWIFKDCMVQRRRIDWNETERREMQKGTI